ncbi:MAG TPA: alanine--tRNA ligase-related protein, partial [Opitutaceae bacterium]
LGDTFPELKERRSLIERVIHGEEESFGRTLDRGLERFNRTIAATKHNEKVVIAAQKNHPGPSPIPFLLFPAQDAFELYDTYGFPLDMTELLAAEHGYAVNVEGFNELMEQQRARARAAQKKEVVVAATEGDEAVHHAPTEFLGYTQLEADAKLIEAISSENGTWLVFDRTPFYAEMGGQTGDTGSVTFGGHTFEIVDCVKDKSGRFLHQLSPKLQLQLPALNSAATLRVDAVRRRAINRHHSAAHLVHWALRKVLGTHVRQAGTSKTPDRLRFDFMHFEQVKPEQLVEIERLVNEKVIDNGSVEAGEFDYSLVKGRSDILQFFGDKYGARVRVVQIGGTAKADRTPALDGFSMELCGGTHVTTTGEIGVVKIVAEMAIAAGTRRVEAVAGSAALDFIAACDAALGAVNSRLSAGAADVVQKVDLLIAQKAALEKKLKSFEQKAASGVADELAAAARERDGLKFVSAVVTTESAETLRSLGSQVLAKIGEGVVQLGAVIGDKATVVALASPAAIKSGHQAGKIVAALCAALGGKGGGRAEYAMGGGRDVAKLAEVLKQS